MNSKSFLVLVLLAGLAALGAWFLAFRPAPAPGTTPGSGGAATTAVGDRLAPAISERADAIAVIEIVTAGSEDGPVRLERDGDGWALASKAGFPAEADRVRQLVTSLSELRTAEPKTANPAYYDRLAVQWPDDAERDEDDFSPRPTLVRLLDGEGAPIAEVVLGETTFSGGESRRYARVLGEEQSWLVSGSVTIPFGPLGFVNTRFVELPRESVQSVTVVQSDGAALRLSREEPDGDFIVVEIPDGMAMTNQALANNTGNALAFVNFTDVEAVARGDELDWSGMAPVGISGILEVNQVSAYFTTFDGGSISLILEPIREDGTLVGGWAVVGGEGDVSGALTEKQAGLRFKLPAGTIESLTRRPSELLEDAAPEEAGPALPDGPGLPPPADAPAEDG